QGSSPKPSVKRKGGWGGSSTVAFEPGGRWLAVADPQANCAYLLDLSKPNEETAFVRLPQRSGKKVSDGLALTSPDGQGFVNDDTDGFVSIWTLSGPDPTVPFARLAAGPPPKNAVFSP